MIHVFIGALVMASALWIIYYTRIKKIRILWWQWILTAVGLLYALFVLELITGFLQEGSYRGALVMGVLFGFAAAVWGVLLGRFVFSRKGRVDRSHNPVEGKG